MFLSAPPFTVRRVRHARRRLRPPRCLASAPPPPPRRPRPPRARNPFGRPGLAVAAPYFPASGHGMSSTMPSSPATPSLAVPSNECLVSSMSRWTSSPALFSPPRIAAVAHRRGRRHARAGRRFDRPLACTPGPHPGLGPTRRPAWPRSGPALRPAASASIPACKPAWADLWAGPTVKSVKLENKMEFK